MRFAIASDDGKQIASHTGRCQYFVIFESTNEEPHKVEERVNTFTAHAKGEHVEKHQTPASHKGHEDVIQGLSDCGFLICRGAGRRLVADLSSQGIQIIFTAEDAVEEAARLFVSGELDTQQQNLCSHTTR